MVVNHRRRPALARSGHSLLHNHQDWSELLHSSLDSKDSVSSRYTYTLPYETDTLEVGDIISWELELYDLQPATLSGFDKEFISGGRIDDKLCSWSALQALLGSTYTGPSSDDDDSSAPSKSSIIKLVALFDDEEIGSLLRQGAQGNFLPSVIERTVDSFSKASPGANLINQTYANSYLISADVSHAVNPNFLNVYLEHHMPRLNVGPAVSCDPNGHMTTDAVSSALISRIAEKSGSKLQVFQIRNDSRSGGTVGPVGDSACLYVAVC
jgi:aminopeptidase I